MIVGEGMTQSVGTANKNHTCSSRIKYQPKMINQGASEISMMLVFQEKMQIKLCYQLMSIAIMVCMLKNLCPK